MNVQTMILSPLQIPENALDSIKVNSVESMHKVGNYMDCIGNENES